MAINRYSRGPQAAEIASEFIPMPVDLIDRQVQRRQSAYDKAKAALHTTEDNFLKVKSLGVDQPVMKEVIEGYESDISKNIEDAGGDYSRLTSYADELGRTVQRDLASGKLGAIQQNYLKAQGHMAELKERYDKGDISKAGYRRGLHSISQFKGTEELEDGTYSQFSGYRPGAYVDFTKKAQDMGKSIHEQYDKQGLKYKDVGSMTQMLSNGLYNDPEIRAALEEEVWGKYGDLDPRSKQIAMQNEINRIAKIEAQKLAFHEVLKPDGQDAQGNMIKQLTFGTGEQGMPQYLRAEASIPKLNQYAASWMKDVAGFGKALFTGMPGSSMQSAAIASQAAITATRANKTAIAKDIINDPKFVDIAKTYGIDVTGDPETVVERFLAKQEAANARTVAAPITVTTNQKKVENFEDTWLNNWGLAYNQVDVLDSEGNPLPKNERVALVQRHMAESNKGPSDKTGEGLLKYGGEISNMDSPYTPGTTVIHSIEDGKMKTYYVSPDLSTLQNKGLQVNRIAYAAKSPTKTSTFKMNGRSYTSIYTTDDNNQPVYNLYLGEAKVGSYTPDQITQMTKNLTQ